MLWCTVYIGFHIPTNHTAFSRNSMYFLRDVPNLCLLELVPYLPYITLNSLTLTFYPSASCESFIFPWRSEVSSKIFLVLSEAVLHSSDIVWRLGYSYLKWKYYDAVFKVWMSSFTNAISIICPNNLDFSSLSSFLSLILNSGKDTSRPLYIASRFLLLLFPVMHSQI